MIRALACFSRQRTGKGRDSGVQVTTRWAQVDQVDLRQIRTLVGTNSAQLYCQLHEPSVGFHAHFAGNGCAMGGNGRGRHPAAGTLPWADPRRQALSEGAGGAGAGPREQVGWLELARGRERNATPFSGHLPGCSEHRAQLGNDQIATPASRSSQFNGAAEESTSHQDKGRAVVKGGRGSADPKVSLGSRGGTRRPSSARVWERPSQRMMESPLGDAVLAGRD